MNQKHLAWLRPLLAPMSKSFSEVAVMSFFVNLLALAVPVFVLQVYDRVVYHGGLNTLVGLVAGMVLVLIFDFILRQSRARIMQTVALRIDAQIGRRLFDKMFSLPLRVLETRTAANWQILYRDLDTVRNTLSGATALLVVDLPFAVLFFGVVTVIALPLAWVLAVLLPVFVLVAWRSGISVRKAGTQERGTQQSRDALIAEILAGRTTVKALGLERAMRPTWEDVQAQTIEGATQRGARTDFYGNIGVTLTLFTTVALTVVGALAILDQQLTIGALIATNMLSGRMIQPLNQLVGQWRNYSGFLDSARRLGEVFDMPSERTQEAISLERPAGELRLEKIRFRYTPNGPLAIDDVAIGLKAGGMTALVGRNGCGKSTLMKLIQGLYRPEEGRVLLDGADIAQFTRRELARWIGYVPQECVLFQGTIRDNLAHRMPEADDEEILRAAKAAGVHNAIIDLPDGYASDVGEAGHRLSGGQRQRLVIARALVGDPPVLLLDEPSGSLDRQAEEDLRDHLRTLAADHTIILITHSPVLLGACDSVIGLDRGRIALAGPSREILPKLFGLPTPAPKPAKVVKGAAS